MPYIFENKTTTKQILKPNSRQTPSFLPYRGKRLFKSEQEI
jgi:hypothetical protein